MRSAAARVRELAEELEQLSTDPDVADPQQRLETVAVLGVAWVLVAVCDAIAPLVVDDEG